MYTRVPSGRMPRGMRVPENYAGNAFRAYEPSPPRPVSFPIPPQEEAPPPIEEITPPPTADNAPQEADGAAEAPHTPVSASPSPLGLRLPFQGLFRSSGLHIGIEELLLIGLILMISQEGKNDDLIWLLILLLLIPS